MYGGWGHSNRVPSRKNSFLASACTELDARFYTIICFSYSDEEIERCQMLSNLGVDRGTDV